MSDLWDILIHPLPNAVMTVIMGVLAVYWLFTLLLGVGVEDLDLGFDFDFDAGDVDLDVDAGDVGGEGGGDGGSGEGGGDDADTEHDVARDKSPGSFMKFLNFMNVGRVPFMLVLSTLKLFMWLGSLITTSLVSMTSWGLTSLFILIPIGAVSVLFTKWATNPLVKFFKAIGYKGEEEIDFLGRSGVMLSTIKEGKIGTAEFTIGHNPFKLNVKSLDGAELKYGEYVVIMDESEDKKYYLVNKEVSIRNL